MQLDRKWPDLLWLEECKVLEDQRGFVLALAEPATSTCAPNTCTMLPPPAVVAPKKWGKFWREKCSHCLLDVIWCLYDTQTGGVWGDPGDVESTGERRGWMFAAIDNVSYFWKKWTRFGQWVSFYVLYPWTPWRPRPPFHGRLVHTSMTK